MTIEKLTSSIPKIAVATQISGNVFSVLYPHTSDCDRDVSYSYLRRLVRNGCQVVVKASAYGPEHIVKI